ncbi:putative multi-domain containing protein [Aduncisulcus paluster]|uniref:H/ACA ribonucleoprotein complex subunit 2 n=1 Tax=Aduncisulcus paluster TaxID=2918883 RepID=A0ABQ5K4K7_9EUKA|nr:putative multi-domain containing protein [Aduncisulcus paluster]|eukprot:gnl/Carplike_NY0171/428_a588_3768.p1 GENE.gnl/Carplike_NY0171/428_a588_3768~~gnl/Carplike_NY0171/428_a588_3768.p1  ORF type:complete len:132 (+),score=55.19 gnl/Carplike_NY0171/428_a588_3768:27-422(+)
MPTTIYPLANKDLTVRLFDLVKQAESLGQIRRGANETTKALHKNKAELIIIAADTDPIEIVLHLPLLCEDKNVPYVYVPSMQLLGRASGVSRTVIACAIMKAPGSSMQREIEAMKDAVEKAASKEEGEEEE